jgi:hypothetical protein
MSEIGGEGPREITRIEQLQERLGDLLSRINGDQRLAQAAAANPLLALEELGFRLAPEIRREIERRGRYSRRQLVRREGLLAEFTRSVPGYSIEEVDLLSAGEVRRLLREILKVEPGRMPANLDLRRTRVTAGEKVTDPLESVADAHPAIPTLIALRAIERQALGFASPSVYRAIRSGELKLPISAISARPAGGVADKANARQDARGSVAGGGPSKADG